MLCILLSHVTLSNLGPNIILSTLFSDTLSLCLSRNVRHQVSQPYITTDKIIVLHILIFIPLGWNVRSVCSSGSLTSRQGISEV